MKRSNKWLCLSCNKDTKLTADIWITYFVNGKSYIDEIDYTFPEFDSNKLN